MQHLESYSFIKNKYETIFGVKIIETPTPNIDIKINDIKSIVTILDSQKIGQRYVKDEVSLYPIQRNFSYLIADNLLDSFEQDLVLESVFKKCELDLTNIVKNAKNLLLEKFFHVNNILFFVTPCICDTTYTFDTFQTKIISKYYFSFYAYKEEKLK